MNIFSDGFFSLFWFIGAIAFLIIIHELGHFIVARLLNVEVEEFGLGLPPRVKTLFTAWGTKFTLNWIPLGGFVRPKGENDPTVEGGLAAAKPWVRISVLLAGPLMNFIAGAVIFTLIFAKLGEPIWDRVEIKEVSPNSPAAGAMLQVGDLVDKVNGEDITSTAQLTEIINANRGIEIEMLLERETGTHRAEMVPRIDPPEGQGATGITIGNPTQPISILSAFSLGVKTVFDQMGAIISLPGRLISGELAPEQGRLVGYKTMYDMFSNMRDLDTVERPAGMPEGLNTLNFIGIISVSIALLNLMPFPALDGGRILFVLPEIIIRKRIPSEYENALNLIGITFLLLVMIYVNLLDFINPVVLP